MPLEIKRHTVPHLKVLNSGLDPELGVGMAGLLHCITPPNKKLTDHVNVVHLKLKPFVCKGCSAHSGYRDLGLCNRN